MQKTYNDPKIVFLIVVLDKIMVFAKIINISFKIYNAHEAYVN